MTKHDPNIYSRIISLISHPCLEQHMGHKGHKGGRGAEQITSVAAIKLRPSGRQLF